jgi:hypothetical protein
VTSDLELQTLPHVVDMDRRGATSLRAVRRTVTGLGDRPQSILFGAPNANPDPASPASSPDQMRKPVTSTPTRILGAAACALLFAGCASQKGQPTTQFDFGPALPAPQAAGAPAAGAPPPRWAPSSSPTSPARPRWTTSAWSTA